MESHKDRLDKFTRAAMRTLRSRFLVNWIPDGKYGRGHGTYTTEPLPLEGAAVRCVEIAKAVMNAVDTAAKQDLDKRNGKR